MLDVYSPQTSHCDPSSPSPSSIYSLGDSIVLGEEGKPGNAETPSPLISTTSCSETEPTTPPFSEQSPFTLKVINTAPSASKLLVTSETTLNELTEAPHRDGVTVTLKYTSEHADGSYTTERASIFVPKASFTRYKQLTRNHVVNWEVLQDVLSRVEDVVKVPVNDVIHVWPRVTETIFDPDHLVLGPTEGWEHNTLEANNVYIAPSIIDVPGGSAGNGVFANRGFREGEIIAFFGGRLQHESNKMEIDCDSDYVLVIGKGWEIDGKWAENTLGHMINSTTPETGYFKTTGKRVKRNVRFGRFADLIKYNGILPVRADRFIRKGEELITSYGINFWRVRNLKRKLTEGPNLFNDNKRRCRRKANKKMASVIEFLRSED